jgi:hypothetical protein
MVVVGWMGCVCVCVCVVDNSEYVRTSPSAGT